MWILWGMQLNGIRRGDEELTFTVKMKTDEYWDESSTPKKKQRRERDERVMFGFRHLNIEEGHAYDSNIHSEEAAATMIYSMSPDTPPIYNHRNSNRRKGIPHRAPF